MCKAWLYALLLLNSYLRLKPDPGKKDANQTKDTKANVKQEGMKGSGKQETPEESDDESNDGEARVKPASMVLILFH